jgi:hypothetical protein
MNKFNEVAQTVLQKESAYARLNNFLKEKGIETADLFIVQDLIKEIIAEYNKDRNKN